MNKQIIIFVTWSAITAVSLGFAVQQPEMAEPSGPAIAQLSARKGTVQFRREGATLWVDTGTRQVFQDGTLLATGAKSTAAVVFRDGREITLGESSQVILTLSDDDDDSVVTLLKGSLRSRKAKAVAAAKVPKRLIINAGDKSVSLLKKDDRITIEKKVGTPAPKIAMLGGLPIVAAPVAIKAVTPALPVGKLATSEVVSEPRQLPIDTKAPQVAVVTPKEPVAEPAPAATGPDTRLGAPEEIEILEDEPFVEEVAEEERPTPVKTPKQPPAVKATAATPVVPVAPTKQAIRVEVPRIISPGARLWTARSLAGGGAPLSITLSGDVPLDQANASVEMLRGDRTVRQLKVERSGGRLIAKLGRDAIAEGGVREKGAGLTLSLRAKVLPRPGAELDIKNDKAGPVEIELASLADVPKGGASVYVSTISPENGDGWFPQRGTVAPGKAAAGVHLSNSADLVRLAPLLRGAGAFSVQKERESIDKNATNIVRSGRLAARVSPDSAGAGRYVRRALDADLAFKGAADSYLGSGASLAAERTSDERWKAKPTLTLIDQQSAPAKINTALLSHRAGAWDVVARQGRAVFNDQVKLVDPPATARPDTQGDVATVKSRAGNKIEFSDGSLRVPKRLIFVEGMASDGEPRFLTIDHRKFNALGIMTAASAGQSAFALTLNPNTKRQLAKTQGESRQSAHALQAMLLAEADAVVLSPRDGSAWTIAINENGSLRKLASAPAPGKPNDAATVHDWVVGTLGLKDRLVATAGRAAIVLAPSKSKVGTQGVIVTGKENASRSIVEIVGEASGPTGRFAVITVVTGNEDESAIPSGARVLWE